MPVLLVKQRITVFEVPFGGWGLRVTVVFHHWLVGKLVIDFLSIIIEYFSLFLTAFVEGGGSL